MTKINKRLYTKEEWHRIRDARRKEKQNKVQSLKIIEELPVEAAAEIKSASAAFVLGNGTSRKSIPLESLSPHGKIYACNAVYRTFSPDYLIAVDTKMILEIAKAGYQLENEVWTNPNKVYSKIKNLNFFSPPKGWSSGPTALDMASRHGHQDIYILGFDFKGIDEKVNNIFADTQNYKRSIDRATYYGNWLRQTTLTIQKNPKTRYIRVIEPCGFVPNELKQFGNVTHITAGEFIEQFGI